MTGWLSFVPDTVPTDLLILSRAAICIFAGEVAIRYAAWAHLILRNRDRLYTPISLVWIGISGWALSRFSVEFRWVLAVGDPDNVHRVASLVENDWISELSRISILFFMGLLTYPVTKIQYRHSLERALVETTVRFFLIACSAVIGYMFALAQIYRAAH